MNAPGMCRTFGCPRHAVAGRFRCPEHTLVPVDAEYEAARVNRDERARWDVWDDGGLEAPGDDEL